jgi:hypothetical protein
VVVMLAGRPLQESRVSRTERDEVGLSPAKVPRVHGYRGIRTAPLRTGTIDEVQAATGIPDCYIELRKEFFR